MRRACATAAEAARRSVHDLPPPPRAPGARVPVLGSALRLALSGGPSRLHLFVDERHRSLGPIYADRLGPAEGVFVSDAEAMRRVFALEGPRPRHVLPDAWALYNERKGCRRGLFFMDGEEWWEHRRVLNRLLLRSQALEAAAEAGRVAAEALVGRWASQCGHAPLKALEDDLYLWALEANAVLLVGAEHFLARQSALLPALKRVALLVRGVFVHSSRLSLVPASLARALQTSVWKEFEKSVDDTLAAARALMEVARAGPREGLLAQLEAEGLSEDSIQRVVVDLILAAGDTTVHSLQWLLLALARDPPLQERLYAEVYAAHAQSADARRLAEQPLLRWSVREALRLFPVAAFVTRFMPKQCALAGHRIDAGTLVIMSLYTSGRDERYFPRPLDFWPERWERTKKDFACDASAGESVAATTAVGVYAGATEPWASMPFAAGARSCVGRRAASAQLALGAALIVNNFRVEVLNVKPVEMSLRMVAVPSEPLLIKLTKR